MKKKLLLFSIFIILFIKPYTVHSQWYWSSPKPQGLDLWDVFFVNNSVGYAVGTAGTIVKTTDGGTSWSLQNSGFNRLLEGVFFTHADTGYAVGDYGGILKTVDGGANWNLLNTGVTSRFNSIHCINKNLCVVAGEDGLIMRTTDGGVTWSTINSGTTNDFRTITFSNATNGFIGGQGAGILKTTDAGLTWTSASVTGAGAGSNIFIDISFYDANNGYACGYNTNNRIFKTTDGGTTWTYASGFSSGTNYMGVCFTSATVGYVVASNGTVGKTINGGTSWTLDHTATHASYAAASIPGGNVYAVGSNGGMSMGNGTIWANLTPYAKGTLYDIYFIPSTNTGYAVGLSGSIAKTIDNGDTWINQTLANTAINPHGVFFTDEDHGCVVGNNGLILKTVNGGTSWTTIQPGVFTHSMTDIAFTDANNGFAVGSGKLLRTTNGGTSWTEVSGVGGDKIEFADAMNGYICGGSLFKTTDGGNNWTSMGAGGFAFSMVDKDTLFMANGSMFYSYFYRSVDGGVNWEIVGEDSYGTTDMHFVSSLVGYAVNGGEIFCTVSGGSGWWTKQESPSFATTAREYSRIYFRDKNTGFALSWFGTIMRTLNGGNPCQNNVPSFLSVAVDDTICVGDGLYTSVHSSTMNAVFHWQKDGTDIPVSPLNAAYINIYPTQLQDFGTYTCNVYNACGSITSEVEIYDCATTTGLKSFFSQKDSFKIYPNPSQGETTISTEGGEGTLTVVNSYGAVVREYIIDKDSSPLFLNELSTGIYYLNFSDGNNRFSEKLIIIY